MDTKSRKYCCNQERSLRFKHIAAIVLALMLSMPFCVYGSKGGKGGGGGHQGTGGETGASGHSSDTGSSTGHDGGDGHDGGEGHDGNTGAGSSGAGSHGKSSAGAGGAGSAGSKGPSGNAGSGAGGGQGKGMGGGKSGFALDSEGDEDSDQPPWAGKYGDHSLKPGGGNHGSETRKGDDYGDLFVMLRNDDGTLVEVDEEGGVCDAGEDCYTVAVLDDGSYFIMLPDLDVPETVLEVDLGRLNLSRAPEKVLEHALEEALTKLDAKIITLENLDEMTDISGRLLVTEGVAIDSPLENLALYQAVLDAYDDPARLVEIDGEEFLEVRLHDLSLTVDLDVVPQLAASMLAAASDKTGTIEIDEVSYISKFLEVDDELSVMVMDYEDWYDRTTLYDVDLKVVSIVDGEPVITDVNLLDLNLFNDIEPIDDMSTGIDVFTQAADDSVQVLEYIHASFIP